MSQAANLRVRPNLATDACGPASANAAAKAKRLPEGALAIAQNLWQQGNLSPLDTLFGSSAIVNLIPTKGFGFIGHHLGRRLHKYAEDIKSDVDAAEVDSTLTRAHLKPKSQIRSYPWSPGKPVFKKNRYMAFIVSQPSTIEGGVDAVYGQVAQSMKSGGKLFAADLMATDGDAVRVKRVCGNILCGMSIRSHQEHVEILKAAGVRAESKFDLTHEFLSSIRIGFQRSLKTLEELSQLDEEERIERTSAFAEQLAVWKGFYDLIEARKIEVAALLATKPEVEIRQQAGENHGAAFRQPGTEKF
jgi:hypothetical protein